MHGATIKILNVSSDCRDWREHNPSKQLEPST